jgi:hypothetical protein
MESDPSADQLVPSGYLFFAMFLTYLKLSQQYAMVRATHDAQYTGPYILTY